MIVSITAIFILVLAKVLLRSVGLHGHANSIETLITRIQKIVKKILRRE